MINRENELTTLNNGVTFALSAPNTNPVFYIPPGTNATVQASSNNVKNYRNDAIFMAEMFNTVNIFCACNLLNLTEARFT
jgi:hypothetical protein